MRQKLIDVIAWTSVLILISIILASGAWLVTYLVEGSNGDSERVWRVALTLILAATSGGAIANHLQGREPPVE